MMFTIGVASRLDDDHVRMSDLQVETFDDAGAKEMLITLPTSVLDLNTRVLTSKTSVTIKRSDFEVTGDSMEFDTKTKNGRMEGRVRMLIYNRDE
jgi:lipopolysaccharide export system protein LptC